MKLVLLGTTGYHPNDRRQTACLMIPEAGVVLDAGTAMYRVRKFLCTPRLDIFLTHAHLDHVVGLTYLLNVVRDRQVEVTVHALPDKLAAIQEHLLAPELFPVGLPCHFEPLAAKVPLGGGGELTHFPLEHPGGSVGFRLDWPGHSLAYVTDTTATADANYVQAVRGVDLLVHECYFPDGQAQLAELTGHSVTTPVAELARRAGVKQLVLVHLDPGDEQAGAEQLTAAKGIFPAVQLGQDLAEIEF